MISCQWPQCFEFRSVLWCHWLGDRKGIQSVKFPCYLSPGTSAGGSSVQLTNPGPLGKRLSNWCVCMFCQGSPDGGGASWQVAWSAEEARQFAVSEFLRGARGHRPAACCWLFALWCWSHLWQFSGYFVEMLHTALPFTIWWYMCDANSHCSIAEMIWLSLWTAYDLRWALGQTDELLDILA